MRILKEIHTYSFQRYEAMSKPPNFKGHKNLGSFKPVPVSPVEGNLSTEALFVNSKQNHRKGGVREKGEPSRPCVFCRGSQFSDSCNRYVTVNNRKSQLVSQGRCFICLKVGHTYKQCPSAQSRSCYHCKRIGHHHHSICPKQFKVSYDSDNQITESSGLETNQ